MPEAPRRASGSTSIVEVVLDEEAGERCLSPPAIGAVCTIGAIEG